MCNVTKFVNKICKLTNNITCTYTFVTLRVKLFVITNPYLQMIKIVLQEVMQGKKPWPYLKLKLNLSFFQTFFNEDAATKLFQACSTKLKT